MKRLQDTVKFSVAVIAMLLTIAGSAVFAQEKKPSPPVMDQLLKQIADLTVEVQELRQGMLEDPYRAIGSVPGYNPRARYYEVPEGFPKFDARVRFIGNLRGTWKEMGVQYGERAGDLILNVCRYSIDYFKTKGLEEQKLRAAVLRYKEQTDAYAPEMVEFMQGISDGVDWSATRDKDSRVFSNFEKILLVNVFLDLDFFPPRELGKKGERLSELSGTGVARNCTGMALSGKALGNLRSATKTGATIVTNHYDNARFVPYGWNCAYVATPSDPSASVFWSIQPAGMVGGNNLCTNDKGVSIGQFFGGESEDDTYTFGVPYAILQLHALVHSNSAEKAVDMMVFGDKAYRQKTGRVKALQTGLWAALVADRDRVMVLELTPNRHAVRYPGDMGEKGNYVIYANWYGAKHYFDAGNKRVEKPIGIQPPEFPERYWTYDWFIRYHFGEMDEALVQEAEKTTYYFDQETGRRIDNLEGTAVPLYVGMHTISAYWGAALGLDIGGTIHAAQVILSANGSSKINWVQGRPSEWVGPWQSTDFFGYQK